MGGALHHAEATRLLAAIEPRTAPGVGLTARERLELGLLPSDDDARGVDSLHSAAVASFGPPDSHEAVEFGIRCLVALGELCLELECSERLGLVGGHQTVLRLMTQGRISGDARRVVQAPRLSGKNKSGLEAESNTTDVHAPSAIGNISSATNAHHVAAEEEQEGEEDEVQSAAALVAANVVSSGSPFPMRASFPTGDGASGLGRFPLVYDFVVSDAGAAHCTDRVHSSATAVSAAGSPTGGAHAAGEAPLDSESFSILVRPVKERQHSQFDVGFVMWPAAVILSRLLCRHPELVRGRRVLEIGAGLGLAGLVAARLQRTPAKLSEPASHGSADGPGGGSSVTLSDFNPLVLRALEANVALNSGRTAVDAVRGPRDAGDDRGSEGNGRDFRQQVGKCSDEDRATPVGHPTVRVRHLDWDKLGHAPSLGVGRSNSPGGDGDPAPAPERSPGRTRGDRECMDHSEIDCDSDSGELSDWRTGGQQEEGGDGWMKGIERGERFDLIIASDHICQASDAEGTVRVLHAMLAEAAPAPTPTTTVRTPNRPSAGCRATCSTDAPDGSGRYPATSPAQQPPQQQQQQQQQHQGFGDGECYSPSGGGHAHLVVAHPRTRWGVDALVPLLREAPGLSFTCEEVSDPDLVAGLEEASYLAWLHVHVWREAAPADPAAGDGVDEDGREATAEAADEAVHVVG